jgi:hypothetical protein
MGANKFKFRIPRDGDKYINLPVEIKWDFLGQDDSVDKFEGEVVKEIIGSIDDYEVGRFAHQPYDTNTKTDIKYDFHFFSGTDINTSVDSEWVVSYIPEGFTPQEVYYFTKPFTKSFFKLDFYDTKNPISQKNYFTIIIPVQQGSTENVQMSPFKPNVDIKKPSYSLDYVGDKEGFFLYWLRNSDYLNIDTFYMTAKFFDAKLGVFVKMMNSPQSQIPSDKFVFEGSDYFYYDVNLDYVSKTYQVKNNLGSRVGTTTPIKWYEYVNPE